MSDYATDIQIGFRWANAPAFRFTSLSDERVVLAAHRVTAPIDFVIGGRPLTRDVPPQPLLTHIWNLSLAFNALSRGVSSAESVPLAGARASLMLIVRDGELVIRTGVQGESQREASLKVERFRELFLRRLREMKPTLERLPEGGARDTFERRLAVCEQLVRRNTSPAELQVAHADDLVFRQDSVTQADERMSSYLAVDPWEFRNRPPTQWFGQLAHIRHEASPEFYHGPIVPLLTAWIHEEDASLEEKSADFVRSFVSVDQRRQLFEHARDLLQVVAKRAPTDVARALHKLGESAHQRASELLEDVHVSFAARRREIAEITSPATMSPTEQPSQPANGTAEPRPFASSSLRRLRLEREWALTLPESSVVKQIGADRERLLLALQRSLVIAEFASATAFTAARAEPGSQFTYQLDRQLLGFATQRTAQRHVDVGCSVQSGHRRWSFHRNHTQLVEWPEVIRSISPGWWRHLRDGTLYAWDEANGVLHRRLLGAKPEVISLHEESQPLEATQAHILSTEDTRRLALWDVESGVCDWSVPFPERPRFTAIDENFVVLVTDTREGFRVRWLDRGSGVTVWSAELPDGELVVEQTDRGPVVGSVYHGNKLHVVRLDRKTGRPGLVGRFEFENPVSDVRADGYHLFVRTDRSIACAELRGRLHEPAWTTEHHQSFPAEQLRWAISGDIVAILGDHLSLMAAATGEKLFEIPAFWEELVFAEIDDQLHLVVVERRGDGELVVHRLHCRGYLAPVG